MIVSAFRLRVTSTLLAVLLSAGGTVSHAEISVVSGDLLDEIEDVHSHMPGSGSEGFVSPETAELDLWRTMIEAFLDEEIETVDTLVTDHFPWYELFLFTDTGLDSSEYYLLRETFPVTKGWGTLILNTQHEREIEILISHALYETNTHSEGTDIFRRSDARLLIMAGTHRCANDEASPCDGSSSVCGDGLFHISDMAHVIEAIHQVVHESFTARYPQGYSFSLHGTSRGNCEDIFLSNGHATDSQPVLYDLKESLLLSGDISVAVAGDGTSSCPLYGSSNVQGRFTNGSPDPCYQSVSSTTGFFIHAEQQRRVRDSLSVYSKLIDAIKETIPTITTSVVSGKPSFKSLEFSPIHPNPFRSQTRLALTVPRTQNVKVEVFNLSGRRVTLVYDGVMSANQIHHLTLDGNGLPSGLYFVRASGEEISLTRRVILVK